MGDEVLFGKEFYRLGFGGGPVAVGSSEGRKMESRHVVRTDSSVTLSGMRATRKTPSAKVAASSIARLINRRPS